MPETADNQMCKESWVFEPILNRLSSDGDYRRLEPRAVKVLAYLLMRAPSVVSSQELLHLYWPRGTADQRKVTKRISEIRSALADSAREPRFIETVSKQGYRVVASVSRVPLPDEEASSFDEISDRKDGLAYVWSLETVKKSLGSGVDVNGDESIAHTAYLKALTLMGAQDYHYTWLPSAIGALEEAIALDPKHVDALATLGLLKVITGVTLGSAHMQAAKEAATMALSIKDNHPHALTAMAYIALLHDWDTVRAKNILGKALSIAPNDTTVLQGHHLSLRVNEELDEALEVSERLLLAGPSDIRFRAEQIKHFYEVRLYAEAVAAAEEIRRIMPGYADFSEAAALHKLGRFRDSYRSRLAAYRLLGEIGHSRLEILESAYSKDGYLGAWQALWKHQLSDSDHLHGGLIPHERLITNDGDGRQMRELEQEFNQRRAWVIGFSHDPDFDDLRIDAKFDSLVSKMNLPEIVESPAKRADISRVRAFRSHARQALDELTEIIEMYPDNPRMLRWLDSAAWAQFALGEHEEMRHVTERIKDRSEGGHQAAFAYLLEAASWSRDRELRKARAALLKANDMWVGELDYAKDLYPLFHGGDERLSNVFFEAITAIAE